MQGGEQRVLRIRKTAFRKSKRRAILIVLSQSFDERCTRLAPRYTDYAQPGRKRGKHGKQAVYLDTIAAICRRAAAFRCGIQRFENEKSVLSQSAALS